jgi:hypothetical protein
MPTEIAHRVVRRHRAAVAMQNLPAPTSRRVDFVGYGSISAVELARALQPTCGRLTRLVFHQPPDGSTYTIGWAAVDPGGGVVSGTLAFHVSVGEHEVTSWVEATIDPPGSSVVVDPDDLVLLGPAPGTSASTRVAIEYQRRTHGLERSDHDEDTEGGEPSHTQ